MTIQMGVLAPNDLGDYIQLSLNPDLIKPEVVPGLLHKANETPECLAVVFNHCNNRIGTGGAEEGSAKDTIKYVQTPLLCIQANSLVWQKMIQLHQLEEFIVKTSRFIS
ncbi:hypothetical protein SAY87_011211 [Trapa incisa]|uniref:Uncharacterized protein n=1 Tax=Trapa incisa TaxID=236973 RepID=A0AAN7GVX4_9MYRT|nr:hypothetical protein SAY87_011211 [Trapa incisa]